MPLPRRFYLLFIFAVFAVLSAYFFLNQNKLRSSIHKALPDTWATSFDHTSESIEEPNPFNADYKSADEYDDNGFRKVPTSEGGTTTTKHGSNGKSELIYDHSVAEPTTSRADSPTGSVTIPIGAQQKKIRIAVSESGGTHDETTAALVHAFGRQKEAEISLFLLRQRYGIGDVINEFNLSSPIATNKTSFEFEDDLHQSLDSTPPQILVSATCELDLVRLAAPFKILLDGERTFLFCVVHEPEKWAKGELMVKVQPWVEKQMVHFVTLAAHTAHLLRTHAIANWPFNATVLVNHLPPVFPVNVRIAPAPTDQRPLTIALQGTYGKGRNYTTTFSRLKTVMDLAKNRSTNAANKTTPAKHKNVQLHLLGHGDKPVVPSALKSNVKFDQSLDYHSYYSILSQAFSILPNFPSQAYVDSRASTSIPAALIAGTPLIATGEILRTYSYLQTDAVWIQRDDECEMDVVEKVVQWNDEEHARKKINVRRVRDGVIRRNEEVVAVWLQAGLKKIERAAWVL